MKQAIKRKYTEQDCHVQENHYVAHKGVNMLCDTTYFSFFEIMWSSQKTKYSVMFEQ